MPDNNKELEKLIQDHFDIKVAAWDYGDEFDTFTVDNFSDGEDNQYKLVQYDGNFAEQDELVSNMRIVEYRTLKDYELLKPTTPVKGYTVYRLIPYTVQGEPQWD
ncbi:MAG: hypothetical protein ACQR33_01190 [Candidatus Saccharibacteria bacterium]